jgi:hypothetical protein
VRWDGQPIPTDYSKLKQSGAEEDSTLLLALVTERFKKQFEAT